MSVSASAKASCPPPQPRPAPLSRAECAAARRAAANTQARLDTVMEVCQKGDTTMGEKLEDGEGGVAWWRSRDLA
eukprot:680188-Pleurochrysis_carterae.AAC.1